MDQVLHEENDLQEKPIVYICHLCSQSFVERLTFISHLSSHGGMETEATTSLMTRTLQVVECCVCGEELLIEPDASVENFICETCSVSDALTGPQSEFLVPAGFFAQTSNESLGTLHCSYCSEEFQVADISAHTCFQNLNFTKSSFEETQELPEEPVDPLTCKTCTEAFSSLEKIRSHWETSGHPGELMKNVRVVKQNFRIHATLPGDKGAAKKPLLSVKEMFVRVKTGVKCETCEAEFPNQAELDVHKVEGCLTCITCKVTFLNILLLRKHYKYTSHSVLVSKAREEESPPENKPPVECPICKKTITSKFQLNKHLYVHYKGTGWGACYVCYMEFDSVIELVKHVEDAHGTKLYPCTHCDRTFFSESCHSQHESNHTREEAKDFKCELCKLKFPNAHALASHKDHSHQETKKSTCPICGKEIHNSIALRKHEKRHFYNKSLQCGLCLKTFRNKSALFQHNKTHNGMFKVECEVCSRGFTSVSELEEHSIVHTKKKYTCAKCGVKCPSRNSYWIHLKMHDAPYRCDVCQKTYRDLAILNCHRRRHWRIRPYICPHCPRTFSMSTTLRRHVTKHTKAYPHRCALCKKGFLTRYSYHKHLDRLHSVRHSVEAQETETATTPSLHFLADEDLFQSSDTLQIPDDAVILEEDCQVFNVTSDLMNSEVVFETSQSFEQLLH